MINLQLEIFILIGIGYFLSYKKKILPKTRAQLSDLVLDLVLPCAIIKSFEIDITLDQLKACAMVFLGSCLIQVLYQVFNLFLYKNQDENRRINLKYATLVSNAGFLGMPIAQGIFGDLGLLYASIFLIPQRVVMWSAGVKLYAKDEKTNVLRTVLTHPCIIALEIGVLVLVLRMNGIFLPKFIDITIAAIGSCNTPLCLIVIGALLQEADKNDVFSKTTLFYSALRLLILPFVIFFLMKLLPMNVLACNICVVESAMPAASTTAILASRYNRDPGFASKLVFVSTLLSLLTIPLVSMILQMI